MSIPAIPPMFIAGPVVGAATLMMPAAAPAAAALPVAAATAAGVTPAVAAAGVAFGPSLLLGGLAGIGIYCWKRFRGPEPPRYVPPVRIPTHGGHFNRSTNITGYYNQEGRTCYAHAAVSAYINTCERIFGCEVPTPEECFPIADYNNGRGGNVAESIRRLEARFRRGVRCFESEQKPQVLVRDIVSLSVVVSFTTSAQGWRNLAAGNLTERPEGLADSDWHACLIEGYNFAQDVSVLKNSWGDQTAVPRCHLKLSALHDYRITTVYFTSDSIRGRTNAAYVPNMSEPFESTLCGHRIQCVYGDFHTAKYETGWKFDSEPDRHVEGPRNYKGYRADDWVRVKLNGRTHAL